MGLGLRWRAHIWSIWIENDRIKRFKTLPGPGEAILDQKRQNRTKPKKNISKMSLYYVPYSPKGWLPISL